MSEPETTIVPPDAAAAVTAPPAAPARLAAAPTRAPRGGGGLALALAAIALIGAGYALWRNLAFEREHGARLVEIAQNTRLQSDTLGTVARELETIVARGGALERRVADAESVNRSLREELLGLGERARLVEDAVANLADSRLEGAAALRLNEAEFLLRLGAVRLSLFRDAAGAGAAYRLADAQLAELDDATLAGVRQTIAAEIAALDEHGAAPTETTLAELDAVADGLATLPSRVVTLTPDADAVDGAGWGARLARVLGSLVRVRRVDDSGAGALAPLSADTARAAIALELGLAKAALVANDDVALARCLARARAAIARSFDSEAAPVRDALARLDRIAATRPRAALPAIGRALEALTNLRATRAVAEPPATAPPATAPPAPNAPDTTEAPAPDTEPEAT